MVPGATPTSRLVTRRGPRGREVADGHLYGCHRSIISRRSRSSGGPAARSPGSLMPCPAALAHIAARQAASSASSSAPERMRRRRSVSCWANRQLRICPSAVSRVRSHAAQNACETEAMMPTLPRPAVDPPQLAGAEPRGARVRCRSKCLLQGGEHVVGGDGLAALPLVAGVEGHLLDDAQLVSVVEAEPQQRRRRRPAR